MIRSVLVVSRWYPSFDRPESGTFVADHVDALRSCGKQVTVASFDYVPVLAADDVDRGRIHAAEAVWAARLGTDDVLTTPRSWGAGVPVARLPVLKTWPSQTGSDTAEIVARHRAPFMAFARALARRAEEAGQPIDAIHAHTGIPDGMVAAGLAEEFGLGLVISEHDSTLPDRLAHPGTRAAYRALIRSAQLAVVSEAFGRRILAALGDDHVSELPMEVVPNPIPIAMFAAKDEQAARDDDELLWVGARSPHKGIETLLQAMAIARHSRPRLHLRLIGPSPTGDGDWVALAESLGISDHVRFEPATDRAGVADAMHHAGLFVHPSPWETFGMVAAESLAAGLPVAATPSGGVEEILRASPDAAEIASGTGPEALADAILRLRVRLAAIDRTALPVSIERRFSPSAVASRVVELHEIAGARARRQRPRSDRLVVKAVEDRTAASEDDRARSAAESAFLVVARRRVAVERAEAAARSGPITTRIVRTARDATAPRATASRRPQTRWHRLLHRLTSGVRRGRPQRAAPQPQSPVDRVRAGWGELVAASTASTPDAQRVPRIVGVDLEDLELAQVALGEVAREHLAPGSLRWLADRQDVARDTSGTMKTMPYSATDYWSNLHLRDDLSAVGQSGLSPSLNAWLYRALGRNLRRFLSRYGLIGGAAASVFEVGVGTGYWVPLWRSIGARRVDGCDLVPAVVDRLNDRHGGTGTFFAADITDGSSLPSLTYDLVTVMNVLLHVTADAAFERALANIAALVKPGGYLLLTEPILLDPSYARPYDPEAASRARPLDLYSAPLEAQGLELVAIKPAVVLANNPIEASSRPALKRFQRWWRFVVTRSRTTGLVSRAIGPLLYVAEPVAMRTGQAPSSKFALYRRGGAMT